MFNKNASGSEEGEDSRQVCGRLGKMAIYTFLGVIALSGIICSYYLALITTELEKISRDGKRSEIIISDINSWTKAAVGVMESNRFDLLLNVVAVGNYRGKAGFYKIPPGEWRGAALFDAVGKIETLSNVRIDRDGVQFFRPEFKQTFIGKYSSKDPGALKGEFTQADEAGVVGRHPWEGFVITGMTMPGRQE